MAKLLPTSTSAIIKSQKTAVVNPSKFLAVKPKTSALVKSTKESSSFSVDTLQVIEKKVIQIDKLLKDSLLLSKKEDETKRKNKEKEEFNQKERDLESKKLPKLKGINLPTPPKMGFLDWIKNFITKTILGFFAVRLIDFLPQLLKILPVIIKVGDFFIDIGGKMLDGLVTFVDWGYKAIDGTRGFIKQLGGEGLAKNFDKFAGAIDNVIEVAILAALATADSGSGGDLLDLGKDLFKRRGAQQAAQTIGQQTAGTAARGVGIGAGAVAGIVAGTGLISSALGEGAFQIRKVAVKPIQNLENEYKKDKNPFTKIGRGVVLNMVRPLYGVFSTVGFLLDVVGAPFRYAIELLRYPFLSEKDKEKQANNLAKFDVRIREDLRKALNMITLGFAFKEKGSFGNIYGNKGAQKEMMSKMSGGGQPKTRGGKLVGGPSRRTIKKKKKPRTLSFTPRKIKPGANTGGEEKVRQVFPNPEKAWWDPFGAFTGKKQPQQQKPKEKQANPQEFLVNSNDVLGKSKYFIGPTATIILKTVLGQKPDDLDYRNIAKGLSAFVQTTFSGGTLGFAGGGEVDAKQYFSGEDYTEIIAKTIKDSASKEVDTTIRNLSKELSLRPVGREEMIQENIERGTEGGEAFEVGPAGSSGDKLTMARNLMRDLGLTAAQAAGIVGNMAAESGVENARPQGSRPGTKAPLKVDGVTGYGLVQWTSRGRQQALADFARSRGADLSKPLSMDIEYQFFLKEFKGAYGNVLAQIKKAPDVKTASTIFMQQYEIPAGYKTESKIMERYNMSKPIYDKLARGEGKATEGKGSYINSETTGSSGKFKVIEYITGDRNHPNFDLDGHGLTSNYHDHIAFATVAEKDKAKRALRAAGIQIGSENDGRHAVGSYHYKNLAIDIPGHQWKGSGAIGNKEFNGSKKVRSILGIGQNAPRFHGGPILKTGNFFAHKGEYVIDKDSVDLFGIDLIDSINRVENKSQLITKAPSIIEKLKAISGYTDYERPEPEVAFIPLPSQGSSEGYGTTPKPSLSYSGSTIDSMGEQISDSLMYG